MAGQRGSPPCLGRGLIQGTTQVQGPLVLFQAVYPLLENGKGRLVVMGLERGHYRRGTSAWRRSVRTVQGVSLNRSQV